jgi:hypothetical protein
MGLKTEYETHYTLNSKRKVVEIKQKGNTVGISLDYFSEDFKKDLQEMEGYFIDLHVKGLKEFMEG